MIPNPTNNLSHSDLSDIRDAVPALDLLAIRSLRRAGFQIVRQDADMENDQRQAQHSDFMTSDRSSSSAA